MNIDSFAPGLMIYLGLAFLVLLIASQPKSKKKIANELESQRQKAMRPPCDPSLLKKRPEEGFFILGQQGKNYVSWDLKNDGHILIIGGSGSGKSSTYIIPLLIMNPDIPALVYDIKKELSYKSTRKGDERICIFDPQDHNSYGFDPFYSLSESSTDQEILETMRTIAFSLIPLGNSKDTFWPISARNLLIGEMVAYWNMGNHDFIKIIDSILGAPIQQQIEEIINESDPESNQYKYLIQFFGMASETLMSIYSNMSNSLSCFSDTDLRWAFAAEGKKVSPKTLEEKKSVYLAIPENKLSSYAAPIAMITNLCFTAISTRPESSHKILFVLDELPRIAMNSGMESLVEAILTARSRRVSCVIAAQAIEAMELGFSEGQTSTLVSNCSVKIILDASSSKTQKMVCQDWVPQYLERRQSMGSGAKISYNYSFQYTNTLQPADLLQLVPNGESVVITPAGYSMLKKVPYYKDPYMKKIADEIRESYKGE